MELISYNRTAWDRQVEKGIIWSIPVTSRQIQAARQGNWQIVLTPVKPVPATWFPSPLAGSDFLCLASAGGQQGPILGGQMAAGLAVVDLYEDIHPEDPVSAFMPLFMATKAVRLAWSKAIQSKRDELNDINPDSFHTGRAAATPGQRRRRGGFRTRLDQRHF